MNEESRGPEPAGTIPWWEKPDQWAQFERAAMFGMLLSAFAAVQSNLPPMDAAEAGEIVDRLIYKLMSTRSVVGNRLLPITRN